MSRAASVFTDTIFEALDDGRLTEGDLVSPNQVRGHSGAANEIPAWLVSARVRRDVFDALTLDARGQYGTLARILRFGPSRSFWVYALQVGRTQLRLILPLVGETVAAFVHAPQSCVRLFVDSRVEGGVAGPIVLSSTMRRQLQQSHALVYEPMTTARDMVVLTAQLLDPDGMREAAGMLSPQEIHVAGISPPEFSAWTKQKWPGQNEAELRRALAKHRPPNLGVPE